MISRGVSTQSIASIVFFCLAAASLLPTLMTPIPAMVDYVNHLARMYLLSAAGTTDANPYYEVRWALVPNLAMDLLVPPMAQLVGVETATRLFLLISQILIVGGALMLERVVKGRLQFAGFFALMFLYCLPFTWGFVNFQFGVGVALWAIAALIAVVDRSSVVRLLVNAIFVVALFVAHFFALGLYGATIGLYELWRARDRRLSLPKVAVRLMILALPVMALIAAMKSTAGAIGGDDTRWLFAFKPIWPFRILNGYNLTVSAVSMLALIALIYVAAKRGLARFTPAGLWIASGLAVLYLTIPSKLFGTSFADLRVIPAAAMILPAFCSLALPSRRWTLGALAGVTGIALANLAVVLTVWLPYRADYAAMIASFGRLERGTKVLVGTSGPGDDPPFNDLTQYPMFYAPTLAVHYAKAFVPNVFTEIGKQPIQAREAVRHLSIPYGGPMPASVLRAIASGQIPGETQPFVRNWQQDYDYLYLLGPRGENPMPDMLDELERSERFTLYRIRRRP